LLVSGGEGGREGGQGAAVLDLGLLTTPQLHHCVRMENGRLEGGKEGEKEGAFLVPGATPEWKGEDGYIHLLSSAYLTLLSTATAAASTSPPSLPPSPALWVDCAHGIGAVKFPALVAAINETASSDGEEGREGGRERGREGEREGGRSPPIPKCYLGYDEEFTWIYLSLPPSLPPSLPSRQTGRDANQHRRRKERPPSE
jgi:hypothetical protein